MLDTEQGFSKQEQKEASKNCPQLLRLHDYKMELLGIIGLVVYKHFKETKDWNTMNYSQIIHSQMQGMEVEGHSKKTQWIQH